MGSVKMIEKVTSDRKVCIRLYTFSQINIF